MVHSEVYLNIWINMWSAWRRSLRMPALFACFRFLIFHPFFQGESADPICPDVRTPMLMSCFVGIQPEPITGHPFV